MRKSWEDRFFGVTYYRVCRWLLCALLVVEVTMGRWPQAALTILMYVYATYEYRKAFKDSE